MKRLIALSLALAILLCGAACDSKENDNASKGKSLNTSSVDEVSSQTASEIVPSVNDYQERAYKFSEIADYYKVDGRSGISLLSDSVTPALCLENGADCLTFKADCEGDVMLNIEFTSKSETLPEETKGFIRAYVDGKDMGRIELKGILNAPVRSTVTIASGLSKGEHTIKVYNCIESKLGKMMIYSVYMNGVPLKKIENSNLYIEFFGDSITAGLGALLNPGDKVKDGTSSYDAIYFDATRTYAFFTAQNLGADLSNPSTSGLAFTTGLSGVSTKDMYERISFTVAKKYDFSRTADIVVISLGTNDHSVLSRAQVTEQELTPAAVELMKEVKEKNPNAKVVWIYGMLGKRIKDSISDAVKQMGDGFYYCEVSEVYKDGGHPNVEAHKKYAQELTDFIKKNVL